MIDELTIERVLEALPHGSGLDADWEEDVDARSPETVWFNGGWHFMDSQGYYGGWVDVEVRYFEHSRVRKVHLMGPMEGKVQVLHRPGDRDVDVVLSNNTMDPEEYEAEAAAICDYLGELIYQTLEDAGLIDVRHEVVDKEVSV